MRFPIRTCELLYLLILALPTYGNELQFFETRYDTDMLTFGVGGMRLSGTGHIDVASVALPAQAAYLYWHGPAEADSTAGGNTTMRFDGELVEGIPIGTSSDNCWSLAASYAYRADITHLIDGNRRYTISELNEPGPPQTLANGVSLVLFHNDGNSSNNVDVVMFDGNDSNQLSEFDPPAWQAAVSNITYTGGLAKMVLHVSDGQFLGGNESLSINDVVVLPRGNSSFNGTTVPDIGNLSLNNQFRGALWDVVTVDITSRLLGTGATTVELSSGAANEQSDCLSLINLSIVLPAGAAPNQPPVEPPAEPMGSTISGINFNDVDGNGLQSCIGNVSTCSEVGVAGIRIFLDLNTNGMADATDPVALTDLLGTFTFSGLTAGTYVVREEQSTNVISTVPAGDSRTIVVGTNELVITSFGNRYPGHITGLVWEDIDFDGSPVDENLSQLGIPDIQVEIYRVMLGIPSLIGRSFSSTGGAFQASSLPFGDYEVVLVESDLSPSLVRRTTPISYLLQLNPTMSSTQVLFGVASDPSPARLSDVEAIDGVITWRTEVETDLLGYQVHRAAWNTDTWVPIDSGLTLPQAGSQDSSYSLNDPLYEPGVTTRYRLIEIQTDLRPRILAELINGTHRPPSDTPKADARILDGTKSNTFDVPKAGNIFLIGSAGRTLLDVTNPQQPMRPVGIWLKGEAGWGHYLYSPAGRRYEWSVSVAVKAAER